MKTRMLVMVMSLGFMSCMPHMPVHETGHTPVEKLAARLLDLIDDPYIAQAHIGIAVKDLTNDHFILKHNAGKLYTPASNQKLYTTSAALTLLGADYRCQTRFYTTGEVRDSVLHGNLIIYGGGDPTFSGRFYNDNADAVFFQWIDSLKKYGIRSINGTVIGDDSFFDDRRLGEGWNWDDEPFYYSAQIGALSYNDNCVDLIVTPGTNPGDALHIEARPQTNYVEIVNNGITREADSLGDVSFNRQRAGNKIYVNGVLPVNAGPVRESITVEDPAKWFLINLKRAWNSVRFSPSGGFTAKRRAVDTQKKQLFTFYSPPLSALIREINKKSDNFYAEQIFKILAAEKNKKGTAGQATAIVRDWLTAQGIALDAAIFVDGSGLSRMDQIAPIATVTLLETMYHHPDFNIFYESLPIAGVDGTLKNRMKNGLAKGVARAKTGFVRYTRTLSGYTTDQDGHDYAFSLMMNHYAVPTAYINHLQDRLVETLTRFKR